MSWLLRVEDTLYLMQGGTNQYTDKVQIDVDSFENFKWSDKNPEVRQALGIDPVRQQP